ncbi:unnamed protein product, partial [marine sediment metagenome]
LELIFSECHQANITVSDFVHGTINLASEEMTRKL